MKTALLKFLAWLVPFMLELLYDRILTEAIRRAELSGKDGATKLKMATETVVQRAPEVLREVGEEQLKRAIDRHVDKALKR